jgi:hypothetical protein
MSSLSCALPKAGFLDDLHRGWKRDPITVINSNCQPWLKTDQPISPIGESRQYDTDRSNLQRAKQKSPITVTDDRLIQGANTSEGRSSGATSFPLPNSGPMHQVLESTRKSPFTRVSGFPLSTSSAQCIKSSNTVHTLTINNLQTSEKSDPWFPSFKSDPLDAPEALVGRLLIFRTATATSVNGLHCRGNANRLQWFASVKSVRFKFGQS